MVIEYGDVHNRIVSGLDNARLSDKFLDNLINKFYSSNIGWAVIGGAPRDWVIGKYSPSDIDIMADTSPKNLSKIVSDVAGSFSDISLKKTGLGGMRVERGLIVDAWAASNTPNLSNEIKKNRGIFYAVSKAIPVSICTLILDSSGKIYENGFFDSLNSGVIELNDSNITRPKRLAFKIKRLCELYDFSLSKSAKKFVKRYTNGN